MDLRKLSRKQKAYIGAFAAVVGLLAWAFISAGIITHNFNRSQLQTDQDRQEAMINGIILTETKDEKNIGKYMVKPVTMIAKTVLPCSIM